MKIGFYFKLAIDGMRKNKRLYIPYLITCIMMTATLYIITSLSHSEVLRRVQGGSETEMILELGSWVVLIFSAIFLFYTGSFLTKRRKKEFGLYNVLGMDKRGILGILLCENLVTYAFSILAGIIIGVLVSKMAELGLVNAIRGQVDFKFRISISDIRYTAFFLLMIFVLIFLFSLIQIRVLKPIEMLKSENVGEKPPKANWLLGILGIILLGGAYYLAIKIENPLEALLYFFIAVIMVIVGTYMVFMAGSVLLCKILQKNKKYYYQPEHFVSVSSMAYRMKRNGAGLASICILITMVLVMISSSSCLYFGADDCMRSRYPRDINVYMGLSGTLEEKGNYLDNIENMVKNLTESLGGSMDNLAETEFYVIAGTLEKENHIRYEVIDGDFDISGYGNIYNIMIMDVNAANAKYGTNYQLNSGESIAFVNGKKPVEGDFSIGDFKTKLVEVHSGKEINLSSNGGVTSEILLFTSDIEVFEEVIGKTNDMNAESDLVYEWFYQFDTDLSEEAQLALTDRIFEEITRIHTPIGKMNFYCENYAAERSDYFASFGGLFVVGIILSIVFLAAAVMIIYYKQISEGYEDSSRFEIMQKVGMTKEGIKKSINSQMLTVFFMPILFAMINIGFAFPFIRKLLILFGLVKLGILILTTVISVLICAVFYLVVYKATSNVYYSIVTEVQA